MVNDDEDCQSKLNVPMGGMCKYGNFITRAEAKCKTPEVGTSWDGEAASDNRY